MSDIVEKLIEITEIKLKKTFSNSTRHQVMSYPNRLNFSCPFCLDSDSNLFAKRGNIYLNYNIYKCYNDGCSASFLPLTKYLIYVDGINKFSLSEIDALKSQVMTRQDYRNVSNKSLKSLLIPRDDFKAKFGLREVSECVGTFLYNQILSRGLLKYSLKLLLDLKQERFFILNCDSQGDVLGYQIRNYKKGLPKYTTHTYSNMVLNFEQHIKKFKDPEVISEIDKKSSIFSIFEVDLDEALTVFEGPLDTFFYPKSVSFSGIDRIIRNDAYRYFLDNDKTGLKNSIEIIRNGGVVFMWKQFVEKYPKFNTCKDLNDIIKIEPNVDLNIFEEFYSTSEFDLFFML
jgi:hypothetical protein